MMRQSVVRNGAPGAHRREGFSLIELMVVIGIIAILLSLLLAGVMRVIAVKDKAETLARITAINNAVTTQKSGQSQWSLPYIPQGGYTTTSGTVTTWQPFRLRNSYSATPTGADPGLNSPEAQYIIQVFGMRLTQNSTTKNMELVDLGWPALATYNAANGNVLLDANQTLTFFLTGIPQPNGAQVAFTGFSTSPTAPFTPRATPSEGRRGPVLDLGGGGSSAPKYAVDPTTGLGFCRLLDSYGNPFAFFSAYRGQANQYYGGNNSYSLGKPVPLPYATNGQFENPSGFQLISSGKDGLFGASGTWAAVDHNGQDDLANFSAAVLGAGN
jgi:prepilin-type N-terminal cleavage/methylation domain-containing protein